MKVLFSNPPWWDSEQNGCWRAGVRAGSRWPFTGVIRSTPDNFQYGDYLPYPFFMGYTASFVSHNSKAEVFFRDSIALRESYQSYFNFLENGKFDIIFIESASPSWTHDTDLIAKIKQKISSVKIVVTGPIASAKADEILCEQPVHACIKGEYEKGALRVIEGEKGIIEYDLLTTQEMNDAPTPYYDEQHAYRYFDFFQMGQGCFPHLQLWTSRGCPYKCIFCVWPATMTGNDPDGTGVRQVRHYDADSVESSIRELVSRFPKFRSVYFDDDTFNLGNQHVKDICAVMKKIGLPWGAMCRSDSSSLDLWELMRESGCKAVKLGFESGNQYVVDNIVNKNLDLEQASSVVFELKRLGMIVHGTFTYGLPGETADQMQDTKRFIGSLPFDTVQESGCAAIEGTPLDTLSRLGHLDKYSGAHIDNTFVHNTDGAKKFDQLVRNSAD